MNPMTDHEHPIPPNPHIRPGTITAIEQQKHNANAVSVFLDEKFAFGLHQDVAVQYNLYVGRYVDEETVEQMVHAHRLLKAKGSAIALLARRPRTEHEIRFKLQAKGFREEIIQEVVRRLYELSYLDDEAFTRNFIHDRIRIKGYGPVRLKSELRRLGIAEEHVKAAIDDWAEEDTFYSKALEHARKKYDQLAREPDDLKRKRKMYSFLLRKGHTPDVVLQVLEELDM